MPQADGSIVISTEIDDKKAQQQLNTLTKKIDKIKADLSTNKEKQSGIEKQLQAAKDEALKTEQAIKRLETELKQAQAITSGQVSSTPTQYIETLEKQEQITAELKKQQEILAGQDKETERIDREYTKITDKVIQQTQELEKAETEAGGYAQQLMGASDAAATMSPALDEAAKRMGKLTNRIKKLASRVFVFTLITSALRSVRSWLWECIKTNDEAVSAVANLKGALLTLAQPIVNVIIPAFTALVNVLAKVISAIASIVSWLFGTTVEESAEAAEALYEESNALEDTADAADEAASALAGFDEINQLVTETSSSSSGSSSLDTITPNFSGVSSWLSNLLSELTLKFSLKDILFDWSNLTAEDILAKIFAGLAIVAGAIAGFSIAGLGGALVGITLGAVIGLALANFLFNGDGNLDAEEILKSIVAALAILAGGVVGFAVGGAGGAAIGVLIGAGAAIAIGSLLFNGDGSVSSEEILKSIVTALGAIVGGVLGFVVGGPGGAALGVLVGAGATAAISSLAFDDDGTVSKSEILHLLCNVLALVAGGIIGFVVGGPAGALLGIAVGAGVVAGISALKFSNDTSGSQSSAILDSLCTVLYVIAGGLIGFTMGGPAGAVIGMIVGAGISLAIKKVSLDRTGSTSTWTEDVRDEFKGGGRYAAEGLEEGVEEESAGIGTWLKKNLVDPFVGDFCALFGINSPSTVMAELGKYLPQGLLNGIKSTWGTITTFFSNQIPTIQKTFSTAWSSLSSSTSQAWNGITTTVSNSLASVQRTATTISGSVASAVSGKWDTLKTSTSSTFSSIASTVQTSWGNIRSWWSSNASQYFTASYWRTLGKNMLNGLISMVESGINKILSGISSLVNGISGILNNIPGVNIGKVSWGNVTIPRLAQGAVIPPNREFLAVLGDQSSGNNIEAPESLIRQIVREETGGNNNAEVLSALQSILQALQDGQVIKVNETILGRTTARAINKASAAAGSTLLVV